MIITVDLSDSRWAMPLGMYRIKIAIVVAQCPFCKYDIELRIVRIFTLIIIEELNVLSITRNTGTV